MDDETPDLTFPPLTLAGQPWAITREVFAQVVKTHHLATSPEMIRAAARTVAAKPMAARRTTGQRAGGAVAVVPLTGVITPRGSYLSYLFGGSAGGLMDFREAFREAVQSPDVGAIVLDVDSPGGLTSLVAETAAEVRDARGSKPIIAVANTQASSAAYWIAAQADEIVVTPSGYLGSIGAYILHEDYSGWNENAGIVPTYVHAAQYKVEGNMDEPLEGEALAEFQRVVDENYGMFVDDVAAARGVSADVVRGPDYGEGRQFSAARAVASGMADRIDTFEGVIGALLTPGSTAGAAARAGRLAALAAVRAEDPAPASADVPEPVADEPPADDPAPVADEPPADDPAPVADDAPAEPPVEDAPPAAPELDAEARAAIAAVLAA